MWATFRLPRKVKPGAVLDLSIERPGGGSAVLPDAVRVTPSIPTAVNRRVRALRFIEGDRATPRGIEVDWSVAIKAARPAVVDYRTELVVEVDGREVALLLLGGDFLPQAGCSDSNCLGECPYLFQCELEPSPWGCGCGKLFTAGVPHDLAPGDRVRVTVRAARGSQPDGLSGDDTAETVYGGSGPGFIRGDCNADGTGDLSDIVFLLNFNFLGGAVPSCMAACDADGDGQVAGVVTDSIHAIQFLFLGGPRPPAPYPSCGKTEPGEADPGCIKFPPCE
jgi:hypothetical protein